jgi:hypothetical protein
MPPVFTPKPKGPAIRIFVFKQGRINDSQVTVGIFSIREIE